MVSYRALIAVRPLVSPKGGSRRTKGRASSYAAIHHASALGEYYQAKTGDPHWLFTVQKEGGEKFQQKIQGHIQKFLAGKRNPRVEAYVADLKRDTKKLGKGIADSPRSIAEWGAQRAKSIAPRDTGTLIRAIYWKTIKR